MGRKPIGTGKTYATTDDTIRNPSRYIHAVPSEVQKLRNATATRAASIRMKLLREAGQTWTKHQHTLADSFQNFLIESKALGNLKIPQDINDLVWQSVPKACEITGYKLPERKQKQKRK